MTFTVRNTFVLSVSSLQRSLGLSPDSEVMTPGSWASGRNTALTFAVGLRVKSGGEWNLGPQCSAELLPYLRDELRGTVGENLNWDARKKEHMLD